jgi:hypothetical protein
MVTAWNDVADRVHVVDYGLALTEDELEEMACRKYSGMNVGLALQDCGYMEQNVYDFCLRMTQSNPFRFWPLKGDRASAVKLHFIEHKIKDEVRRMSPYRKLRRVHVNSQSTQEWACRLLEDRTHITLYADRPENHHKVCEELLNEEEIVQVSDSRWQRIETTIPNDQRDCLRYGYVGALMLKKHMKPSRRKMAALKAENITDERPRMVGPSSRPRLTQ